MMNQVMRDHPRLRRSRVTTRRSSKGLSRIRIRRDGTETVAKLLPSQHRPSRQAFSMTIGFVVAG